MQQHTLLTIIFLELRLQFRIRSKPDKNKEALTSIIPYEGEKRVERKRMERTRMGSRLKSITPITPITLKLPTDLSRHLRLSLTASPSPVTPAP
jgi:hypothetical protein